MSRKGIGVALKRVNNANNNLSSWGGHFCRTTMIRLNIVCFLTYLKQRNF